jgi:hypothetical protein
MVLPNPPNPLFFFFFFGTFQKYLINEANLAMGLDRNDRAGLLFLRAQVLD